ncbi:transporter substrate-binding domain-containing protein [Streptomyces sp. NPDC005356]|uniref:transporter substrate-binding domain-containing protein n=1 Tax=Streptomyces sp. NPDC005356 TaxID=3157167 RepID=UPI0033A379CC
MRLRALAGCACGVALLLSGCGGTEEPAESKASADPALKKLLPEKVRSSGVVRGASSFSSPPLYTFAGDGKTPSGVLVELVENAADHLGVKVRWSQIPYSGIVPAMDSGKIDISGAQFSATEANLKAVNILSVYRNTVALLIPRAGKESYDSMTGACGKKFAVIRGATIEPPAVAKVDEACSAAGKDEVSTVPFASSLDALTAIKAGRVDGYVGSQAQTTYLSKQSRGTLATVLAGKFEYYGSGFAISKDQAQLAKAFRAAFDASIEDGSYGKIMHSWKMPETLSSRHADLNVRAQ